MAFRAVTVEDAKAVHRDVLSELRGNDVRVLILLIGLHPVIALDGPGPASDLEGGLRRRNGDAGKGLCLCFGLVEDWLLVSAVIVDRGLVANVDFSLTKLPCSMSVDRGLNLSGALLTDLVRQCWQLSRLVEQLRTGAPSLLEFEKVSN